MNEPLEFLRPVVVDEGVAFCLPQVGGRKRIALATKARLKVSDEAQGLALLAAFAVQAGALYMEAERLARPGVTGPVYLRP